jgi:hypothetical protein
MTDAKDIELGVGGQTFAGIEAGGFSVTRFQFNSDTPVGELEMGHIIGIPESFLKCVHLGRAQGYIQRDKIEALAA